VEPQKAWLGNQEVSMTGRFRTIIGGAAIGTLLFATAAMAEPRTQTRSFDGPRASGMESRTIDRQAGTASRDRSVTRRSDGATASSRFDRSRSDGSVTRSLEQTGFAGRTRSAATTRTRTETGSVLSGTATGRGGETYAIAGERVRTDNGYSASRAVTNSAGELVSSRDASLVRENGTATRTVETTGPQRRPRLRN
jgi:hypothetical protein